MTYRGISWLGFAPSLPISSHARSSSLRSRCPCWVGPLKVMISPTANEAETLGMNYTSAGALSQTGMKYLTAEEGCCALTTLLRFPLCGNHLAGDLTSNTLGNCPDISYLKTQRF